GSRSSAWLPCRADRLDCGFSRRYLIDVVARVRRGVAEAIDFRGQPVSALPAVSDAILGLERLERPSTGTHPYGSLRSHRRRLVLAHAAHPVPAWNLDRGGGRPGLLRSNKTSGHYAVDPDHDRRLPGLTNDWDWSARTARDRRSGPVRGPLWGGLARGRPIRAVDGALAALSFSRASADTNGLRSREAAGGTHVSVCVADRPSDDASGWMGSREARGGGRPIRVWKWCPLCRVSGLATAADRAWGATSDPMVHPRDSHVIAARCPRDCRSYRRPPGCPLDRGPCRDQHFDVDTGLWRDQAFRPSP